MRCGVVCTYMQTRTPTRTSNTTSTFEYLQVTHANIRVILFFFVSALPPRYLWWRRFTVLPWGGGLRLPSGATIASSKVRRREGKRRVMGCCGGAMGCCVYVMLTSPPSSSLHLSPSPPLLLPVLLPPLSSTTIVSSKRLPRSDCPRSTLGCFPEASAHSAYRDLSALMLR